MKTAVSTASAPAAIGPYSQAIRAGAFLFISGQVPIDPATGAVVGEDIGQQTRRALDNIRAILEAAGTSLDAVVKTTVYLQNLEDFAAMNAVYTSYFATPAPARSTIQAARLPRDVRIEIDAIAACS